MRMSRSPRFRELATDRTPARARPSSSAVSESSPDCCSPGAMAHSAAMIGFARRPFEFQPNGLAANAEVGEQFIDAALPANGTVRDQCDAVHAALDFVEEMARQHHHHTAIEQSTQRFVEHAHSLEVESVGRLIEHDHSRLAEDRLGEVEPLPHPLRKGPNLLRRVGVEANRSQGAGHLAQSHLFQAREERERSARAHLRVEGQRLGHEADLPLVLREIRIRQGSTLETHTPGVGMMDAHEDLQQRRFPTAVVAYERRQFPARKDAARSAQHGLARPIGELDVLGLQLESIHRVTGRINGKRSMMAAPRITGNWFSIRRNSLMAGLSRITRNTGNVSTRRSLNRVTRNRVSPIPSRSRSQPT